MASEELFDKAWMVEDDPIASYMIRLHVDSKTDDTIASMLVRFENGKTGPVALRKGLVGFRNKWRKDKRVAMIKDLIDKIEFRIDGADLIATANFGGPGDVGKLMAATSFLPMLMFFTAARDVQVAVGAPAAAGEVEVKEVKAEAVDQTEKKGPKKKDAEKKGGKTGK